MSPNDEEVKLRILADIQQAVSGLSALTSQFGKVVKSLEAISGTTTATDRTVQKFMGSWTESAKTGTKSAEDFGDKFIDALDGVAEAAAETAASINPLDEEIEDLATKAVEFGFDIANMATSLEDFRVRIAAGDEALTKSLDDVGISIRDLQELEPHEQFLQVMEALQSTVPAAEQAAKAVEIFGESMRSSAEAVVALPADELREAMGAMRQDAEKDAGFWQSFWDQWVVGANNSATATEVWGNQISEALSNARRAIGDAFQSLPDLVTNAADLGDSLLTMSNRLDVSVEKLSELRYISSQTGAPMEGLARVIFDLGVRAQQGSDKFVAAIAKVGISLEQLKNLPPDEAFFMLLQAIQTTVPVAEQSAVAMEIFGTRFRQSAMLLREDTVKIREQFRALGLEMTSEFAKAGDEFNDKVDDIRKVQEKWKNDIAEFVLPSINNLLTLLPELGGAVVTVGDGMVGFAQSMVPVVANFATISSALIDTGLSAKLKQLWTGFTSLGIVMASSSAIAAAWGVAIAALATPIGVAIAAVGALTLAAKALQQWMLKRKEDSERVAAAMRQEATDASNLARINERLKSSYKTLAEAEAAWRIQQKREGTGGGKSAADAQLEKIQKDLASLDASERAHIKTLLDKHVALKTVAESYKVSEEAIQSLQDIFQEGEAGAKKGAEAKKRAEEFQLAFEESIRKNKEDWKEFWNDIDRLAADGASKKSDITQILEDRYTGPIVKAMTDTATAVARINDEMFAADKTGLDKRFALIARAEAREIDAARARVGISDELRAREIAAIEQKYRNERALALRYTGNVLRDAEMRSLKTRQQLQVEYSTELQVLLDMKKNREKFTDEVIKQQERIVKGAKAAATGEQNAFIEAFGKIAQAVDQTSASLARLGDVSGNETLGKFAKGYQKASQYIKDGAQAAKAWAEGDYLSAVIQSINIAINLVGDLWDSFTKSPGEKAAREALRDFGVEIDEALGDSIAKTADELFRGDRFAASIYRLKDLINEAGGITEQNFTKMIGRLRDTFSLLESGMFTVEQARDVIEENFGAFAEYMENTREIVSDSFLEIIDLNARLGTNSEQIRAFIDKQTKTIGQGLASQLSAAKGSYQNLAKNIEDGKKALDELAEKKKEYDRLAAEGRLGADDSRKRAEIEKEYAAALEKVNGLLAVQKAGAADTADDMERVGRLAVASFNAAIARGADWLTAMEGIAPALDSIIDLQANLGIESNNAAVNELLRYRRLTEEHKGLFEAATNLNQVMVAMSSIGALNEETLADLEAQGLDTFNQLVNAGLDEKQALMQMKDWLKNVKKAHEDMGIPIDENTQRLIDQATAQGILEEEGTGTNDILIDGLGRIIELLGGELPESFRTMANSASDAADSVESEFTDRVTDGVDGVNEALVENEWQTYAQAASDAATEIRSKLRGGVDDAIAGIADRLYDQDWTTWSDELIEAAGKAEEAINAVSLGRSPGGVKEIAIKMREAMAAFRQFESVGVKASGNVERAINEIDGAAPSAAPVGDGEGEAASSVALTFQISAMDGPSVQRSVETQVLPAIVKALRRGMNLTDLRELVGTS